MRATLPPLRTAPSGSGVLSLDTLIAMSSLSDEFERALAEVEARWSYAPIHDEGFADYLHAHLDAAGDLAGRISRLHIGELFLVWWAMKSPSGVAAFLETFGHDLARAIACVSSRFPHVDAGTLLHQLVAELFDGDDPRAVEFTGFGSLGAWVDVVATQTLLDAAHGLDR